MAAGTKEDTQKSDLPVAKQVWAAEEIRCRIVDLSKTWKVRDAPDPNDPNLTPAEMDSVPVPEFPDPTVIVYFVPKPVFEIVIDDEGKVDRIGLIQGKVDPNLEALVESITRWRFKAANFKGKPICSIQIVAMPAVYE